MCLWGAPWSWGALPEHLQTQGGRGNQGTWSLCRCKCFTQGKREGTLLFGKVEEKSLLLLD